MTIMNMSRSGQQKLSQFLFEYGSFMDGLRETPGTIRFNESDFEGCVVLTTKEAEELAAKLKDNSEFFFLQTGNFDHDTDDLYWCLLEKIEQAEKENASN